VGETMQENFVDGSRTAMQKLERALFGPIYGPEYPRLEVQLSIGGLLMNGMLDDLDALERLRVTG
jgi:hypothetical protein